MLQIATFLLASSWLAAIIGDHDNLTEYLVFSVRLYLWQLFPFNSEGTQSISNQKHIYFVDKQITIIIVKLIIYHSFDDWIT